MIVPHCVLVLSAFAPQAEESVPRPSPTAIAAAAAVDFNRDVRPILSESCYACHGPDAGSRKADLRLDTPEGALEEHGGFAAVVPGDLDASELWTRVTSEFEFDRMPPADGPHGPLAPEALDVLRRWIEEGAPWAEHWAFVKPVRHAAPNASDGQHTIDAWIEQRATAAGLTVTGRAAPHQQLRRLTFDLTGLPPTEALIRRWANEPSDAAWAAIVDELLGSPQYAERMAMWWLDAARYADTEGFQSDQTLQNWPWRDWVTTAFADGMPFDEFTVKQFAGDLLPDATPEDVLATCFHRNHMLNGEGGRDPEESRVDYVRDRTNSVGTVWLGLTLECAQCHAHKFDPLTQAEYYSLSAFFDSIAESGRAGGSAGPFLQYTPQSVAPFVASAEADVQVASAAMDAHRAASTEAFGRWVETLCDEVLAGRTAWETQRIEAMASEFGSTLVETPGHVVECIAPGGVQDDFTLTFAPSALERITGIEIEALHTPDDGLGHGDERDFVLTGVEVRAKAATTGEERSLALASSVASIKGRGVDPQHGGAGGLIDDDPRTGWTTRGADVGVSARVVIALEEPLLLENNERLVVVLQHRATVPRALLRRMRVRATDRRGRGLRATAPMPIERLARELPLGFKRESKLREDLFDEFLEDDDSWRAVRQRADRARKQLREVRSAADPRRVTVLGKRDTPRTTYVLERGVWDAKGAEVQRAFPATFAANAVTADASAAPSRIDLARWLVSPEQPLTPRVVANQMWQMLFGAGLVRTPDDFGSQGSRPMHAELLDWLAVELVDSGWDLRYVLRSIVTSDAYRRAAETSASDVQADPGNEFLARGPRHRLPSWMIRDAALAVSGLLDASMGGPPVRPYQPQGVWEDLFMGRFRYEPTVGAGRHRRALYAFWRRNVAPTFLFDHADRRNCAVGVRRTNTPLQALVMLNDGAYIESAKALASQALARDVSTIEERIAWMGERALARSLTPREIERLAETYATVHSHYAARPELAADAVAPSSLDLLSVEQQEARASQTPRERAQHAALSAVAAVLLNLDEFMTHG